MPRKIDKYNTKCATGTTSLRTAVVDERVAQNYVLQTLSFLLSQLREHAVAQLVDALRYKSLVRYPTVSLEFFIDIILPAALWPLG